MPSFSSASSSSSSSASADALPSDSKILRRHLHALSLPTGFLPSVLSNYRSCDSQIWLLDNSSRMAVRDGHVGQRAQWTGRGSERPARDAIERKDDMRRWDELSECVAFHALVATKVWLPTKYLMLNRTTEGYKFTVCWGKREEAASDLDRFRRVLPDQPLKERACPLTARLRSLADGIQREAPSLEANDRHVTVVIVTQGRPTNKEGQNSQEVQREFLREVDALSELPVKIVLRVCSDDEDVTNVFNSLDCQLGGSVDTVYDYWGEAHEVYLHNPWLTYTMGMHRLRESGLAPFLIDDLDKRALGLTEVLMLSQMLLVGEDEHIDLPDPQRNWEGFYQALKALVEKRGKHWNAVRKKPTPWIDLKKLKSIYGEAKREVRSRRPSWDHRPQNASAPPMAPSPKFAAPKMDTIPEAQDQQASRAQKSRERPFAKSMSSSGLNGDNQPAPGAPSRRGSREPPQDASAPPPAQKSRVRPSKSTDAMPEAQDFPSNGHTWSQPASGAQRQHPRKMRPTRRATCDEGDRPSFSNKRSAFKGTPRTNSMGSGAKEPPADRRPAFTKYQSARSFPEPASQVPRQRTRERPFAKSVGSATDAPEDLDVDTSLSLEDILKQWSREPPTYTRVYPLQHLLLTAPDIFPPSNPKVEPHVYFDKWKSVNKEVFSDLDGDELVNMLKKGMP